MTHTYAYMLVINRDVHTLRSLISPYGPAPIPARKEMSFVFEVWDELIHTIP
jgi:hypothetical protein